MEENVRFWNKGPQSRFELRPATLIVLVGISLMMSISPVWGQSESAEEPAEELDVLIVKTREIAGDIEKLKTILEGKSGSAVEAIQKQITLREMQVLELAGGMVEKLAAIEEAGGETSQLRPALEAGMQRITTAIPVHLDQIQKEVADLSEWDRNLTAGELADLEDRRVERMSRLLMLCQAFLAHLDSMEELDLDVSLEKAALGERFWYLAEIESGEIGLTQEVITSLSRRLEQLPDEAELAAQLRVAEDRLDHINESLNQTIGMMDQLDLDTAEYRRLYLETSSAVSFGLLDADVAGALLSDWYAGVLNWLGAVLPGLLGNLLLFLLILSVFVILSRLARKFVRMSVTSSKLNFSQLLQNMITSVVSKAVLLMGVLIGLAQLGVEIGPMLAGLGILGFIVGFALQDSLANFAAGIMILIYRPFDIGDLIDVSGAFGTVNAMSLVSTTVLTIDNQTLVVPNGKIWGDVIRNLTAEEVRRVDLVFGISYGDDIPKAEKVLESILADHQLVLDDPEPIVKLQNLADSAVEFVVRPWVKTDDYWDVLWDVTREVKIRFDKEGISIPFPQRDVHLFEETTK